MERILILSDLHVGSIWGLFPPSFEDKDGNIVKPNAVQRQLFQDWLDFRSRVRERRYEAVFLLGENIEGPDIRHGGRSLTLPDIDDQQRAFIDLLEPLRLDHQEADWFVFSASEWHQLRFQDVDERIAEMLGASWEGLGPKNFTLGGKNINLAHGEGGAYWYRATKLDKIGFSALLAEAGKRYPHCDILIRGHFHFGAWLEYMHQTIAVTPCWQYQTDYMRRLDPFKFLPDIGALEVGVEEGAVFHEFFFYPLRTEISAPFVGRPRTSLLEKLRARLDATSGHERQPEG